MNTVWEAMRSKHIHSWSGYPLPVHPAINGEMSWEGKPGVEELRGAEPVVLSHIAVAQGGASLCSVF